MHFAGLIDIAADLVFVQVVGVADPGQAVVAEQVTAVGDKAIAVAGGGRADVGHHLIAISINDLRNDVRLHNLAAIDHCRDPTDQLQRCQLKCLSKGTGGQ